MNTYDHDMINRYVDGELTQEELKIFEEQMSQDAKLKSEVALYKEVNESLKENLFMDHEALALRDTIEEMRDEYFKPKAKVISFNEIRFWVASAAAIILVVMLVWAPWRQDLFKQYASADMPAVAERGNETDSLLKKATVDFNDKNFSGSIPIFETILKADSANSYVHFYYAIALLQSDDLERSRNELLQLYNGTSLFKYDAAFYMALSYLKEKDKDHCKEWLNKIPADASVYEKAQKLKDKL